MRGFSWFTRILIGGTAVFLAWIFLTHRPYEEPPAPVSHEAEISVGQTVLLGRAGDIDVVPAGESKAAMDELMAADDANDEYNRRELRTSGRVAPIQGGTHALVLRRDGIGEWVVRIQEGPYLNREAWVLEGMMHPA